MPRSKQAPSAEHERGVVSRKWRIIQPSGYESVLGGCVEWHADTRNWQWGVSGAARYSSREAAQAAADLLPDCRDWRGNLIGRPRVVEVEP